MNVLLLSRGLIGDAVAEYLATQGGVNILCPEWPPITAEYVKARKIDLIFSCYWNRILPPDVLSAATQGGLNLHPSVLPKYRGGSPVNWQIITGEKLSGLTLHRMSRRVDAGAILAQTTCDISPRETAKSLTAKLAELVPATLRTVLHDLQRGHVIGEPQDESEATRFRQRKPSDGEIDLTKGAENAERMVRALTYPYPGAFIRIGNKKLVIWNAEVKSCES